ncbi:FprA family A-type flavoprotein [Yanshouia hominis]|uniref:FprA family A-type flavoprotein n=1 Tax=Yanshouia hominis TaxID=2763673 RepID=A0ABR7NLD7_9FIRM|nr:FprA family A-type flavoprotein [Yanshouia hominis]MBC8577205.1 FprA family A-type flavoprotein [Yanshouia hominis]
MIRTRSVTDDMIWVGAGDRRLALFENIFPVPRGVSYNSYLLLDEKTVLFDSVDQSVSRTFLENVSASLDGRSLDYIVIDHMEPDHCSVLEELLSAYPNAAVVGNAKTFVMIEQFYSPLAEARRVVVRDGETLSTGRHCLKFFTAPMVHWPEVMVCFDESNGVLFSADAFGAFGAMAGNIFADELPIQQEWLPDMRRYYANIVGKYGAQVQSLFKKLSGLDLKTICPLHGPVWRTERDITWLLEKYTLWSSYQPEEQKVVIASASIYGNTEAAAERLALELAGLGVTEIEMYDLSATHFSYLIGEMFRCSHIVLSCPTYNGKIFPPMRHLLDDMRELNLQSRTVALIENGSWAPMSGKLMTAELAAMKNMTVLEPAVTLKSSMKEEQAGQLFSLAKQIAGGLKRSL